MRPKRSILVSILTTLKLALKSYFRYFFSSILHASSSSVVELYNALMDDLCVLFLTKLIFEFLCNTKPTQVFHTICNKLK